MQPTSKAEEYYNLLEFQSLIIRFINATDF